MILVLLLAAIPLTQAVEIANQLSRLALRPSENESFSSGLSQRRCYFHAATNFAGETCLDCRTGVRIPRILGLLDSSAKWSGL